MGESKFSKFLSFLLAIIIFVIIALLGYVGYTLYNKYHVNEEATSFVDSYIEEVTNETSDETGDETSDETSAGLNNTGKTSDASSGKRKKYKGFNVVGTIEIPATNCKYPILEEPVTPAKLEVAVVQLWGVGPNQVGNTVIAGHNYRNGLFFSNNKKLVVGDKVYITDNSGTKVKYKIYKKFEATEEDTSFYKRDTKEAREITLTTCTNNSKARIIILAKADDDA